MKKIGLITAVMLASLALSAREVDINGDFQMEDRRRMVQHGFKWQGGDHKGRRAELNPDYVKGECGV